MANWSALAAAVTTRRNALGLTQEDVLEAGGPSVGTLRSIENEHRTSYRQRTFVELERALRWRPGTVQRILEDTAGDDPDQWISDLPVVFPSAEAAAEDPNFDGQSFSNPAATRIGQVVPLLSQALTALSRLPSPSPADEQAMSHVMEALALLRVPLRKSEEHQNHQRDAEAPPTSAPVDVQPATPRRPPSPLAKFSVRKTRRGNREVYELRSKDASPQPRAVIPTHEGSEDAAIEFLRAQGGGQVVVRGADGRVTRRIDVSATGQLTPLDADGRRVEAP